MFPTHSLRRIGAHILDILLLSVMCERWLNYPEIQNRLAAIQPKNVFLPEIVYAELRYGVARSQQKVKNAAQLAALVAPFIRLPFDGKASPHYADIRADLTQRGELIGPNNI